MNIEIVDANRDLIRIDGYEFCGWVIEDEACTVCGHQLIYSETLDAKFCANCNEWREPPCPDPDCMFCSGRRAGRKPLPNK